MKPQMSNNVKSHGNAIMSLTNMKPKRKTKIVFAIISLTASTGFKRVSLIQALPIIRRIRADVLLVCCSGAFRFMLTRC